MKELPITDFIPSGKNLIIDMTKNDPGFFYGMNFYSLANYNDFKFIFELTMEDGQPLTFNTPVNILFSKYNFIIIIRNVKQIPIQDSDNLIFEICKQSNYYNNDEKIIFFTDDVVIPNY